MPGRADQPGPAVRVAYVDVLVIRGNGDALEVLCLRRGPQGRSPGTWECVHAHIDEGETPVETAIRELKEETGLEPLRLYNLSRVEAFYRHSVNEVVLVPVFAAMVPEDSVVRLSEEHDDYGWLAPALARDLITWPRVRREIDDAIALLGTGSAELAQDVLEIVLPESSAPHP